MNDREYTDYSKKLGMDLFGVADLSSASDYIVNQGGKHVGEFPRAISLGVRLIDDVVDQLINHQDIVTIASYRGIYDAANSALDKAAFLIARRIQDDGYCAYPIPASSTLNNEKLEGVFSHKLAAHLAGLGWIGKNCLLITPKYGPRVRLATILTDTPLDAGNPIPNGCGTCRKCVDICPSKALTGVTFSQTEPRDVRFTAIKCDTYTTLRMEKFGNVNCGLCVYVCPLGNKKNNTSNNCARRS